VPALLLVRHGQASFGAADYDVLSERGAEQAAATREALLARGIRPAAFATGSLRRQADTARPWGVRPRVDPRWNEYASEDVLRHHAAVPASLEHRADAPQLSSRDFQGLLDDALLGWIAAGAQGPADEPWPAFRERCLAALEEAMGDLDSGEAGVVFTSGGVVAAIAAALLGVPDEALVALNRVAVNGAVTKVVGGRRGTTLLSYNEHAHLEAGGLVTFR
jgi:broad specificity phosphatase PhoE